MITFRQRFVFSSPSSVLRTPLRALSLLTLLNMAYTTGINKKVFFSNNVVFIVITPPSPAANLFLTTLYLCKFIISIFLLHGTRSSPSSARYRPVHFNNSSHLERWRYIMHLDVPVCVSLPHVWS